MKMGSHKSGDLTSGENLGVFYYLGASEIQQ